MFAAIALDDDYCSYEVSNDHEEDENEDKELEVATKQCNYKPSEEDMNDVEKEALKNLSIWSMCCNILATTFKVMMVCTRLGKHEDAEEDTDHPVDVKHDVVLVPGDHHDGGLQRQLQC